MGARLIFAGTPGFAVPSLEGLIAAGHPPLAVFTQPDRPAGRGRRLTPPPVKAAAEAHGLPVHQPARLDATEEERIRALAPDLMVVVAYGLILPAGVLAAPRLGCVNVHASLLPRWRGAAPIQRAVMAGDRETGITLMRMEAGLDTGPMLARRSTPIGADETAGSLHDRLAAMGAELLTEHLETILAGEAVETPQDEREATYAAKLSRPETRLDLAESAETLARRVRALEPVPGARLKLGGRGVRVREAHALPARDGHDPGAIIAAGPDGIDLATGDGVLRITRLQPDGGRPMACGEYLNGHSLTPGEQAH